MTDLSTPEAVLARAEAAGITLTADGGTLGLRGPRRPDPALLEGAAPTQAGAFSAAGRSEQHSVDQS